MRNTHCEARMKFVDVSALSDSQPSSSYNQDFANISRVKENLITTEYGTADLNQFVLDGSKEIIPDSVDDIVFMSNKKSNENCFFENNPIVHIDFSEKHTSAGITISFGVNVPQKIKVSWYFFGGTKIASKEYEPNGKEYFCKYQADNYGAIDIEFLETKLPNTSATLQYILYGQDIKWSVSQIKNAILFEEVDDTSATLSINTANISILDENNDFDIQNQNGSWKSVQKNQVVEISEYIDGTEYDMGKYYLSEFGFSKNISNFVLVDTIGLMDSYTFYGGKYYNNVKAGIILESIFSAANVKKYSISKDVYDIELTGILEIQTCREALQMVCFACSAIAEDIRSETIRIHRTNKYVTSSITPDRKFDFQIDLDEYVSGVSIEYGKYEQDLSVSLSEIYNGILPKGKSRIEFSKPVIESTISISNGTVIEKSINYVIISMPSEADCVVKGKFYKESSFVYAVNKEVEPGELPNVKTFGKCTLFNKMELRFNAERLLDYYGLRKKIDMRFVSNREKTGDWTSIKSINNNDSSSLLESQKLDLTGGFISTAICRGFSIDTKNIHSTGEIYSGTQWKEL